MDSWGAGAARRCRGSIYLVIGACHDAGAAPPGSYRYRAVWETIDHLLLGPGLFDEVGLSYAGGAGFAVIHDGLLDAGGSPQAFYRGPPTGGHSDHLPLRLELELHPPAR